MMALREALKTVKCFCQKNRISTIYSNQNYLRFIWNRSFRIEQLRYLSSSCISNRTETQTDTQTAIDRQTETRNETGRPDVFGLLAKSEEHTGFRKFNQKKDRIKSRKNSLEPKKSWPSVFGTLAEEENVRESESRRFEDDDHEIDESEKPYRRLDTYERKHYPDWYGRRIAKLGRAGKVYEAVQVLEEEMLGQDRVRPNLYVFTVLIGVLGRHGYTKKAFKIFNQMKKFGLAPQNPTYTALFNACSNSPWPQDGLQRANDLRQLMADKDHQPNMMTYNAMIKAYAKCGDLRTAFSLVDEALAAGLKLDGYCYSSLLMACASDKAAGLKHAIEVWRMMRKRKVTPGTHHYNLLLRIVRDCGLGSDSYMQQLIQHHNALPAGDSQSKPNDLEVGMNSINRHDAQNNQFNQCDEELLLLHPDVNGIQRASVAPVAKQSSVANRGSEATTGLSLASEISADVAHSASILDMDVPNLLNPRAQFRDLMRLELPRSVAGRLALLGGLPGILSHMTRDGAEPDIKTFTILLETVSSLPEMESDLLATMTLRKVKPDVDFCSLMIRKRNLRKDYNGAKDVLRLMERIGLKPDVRTFGCLAMGCSHKEQAVRLFAEMEKVGLVPNTEIFDILVYQSNWDFSYKHYLLVLMKSLNVLPNENLIKKLEMRISQARALIVKKERGESVPGFCEGEKFDNSFRKFVLFYKPWLLSTGLEEIVHPWTQFIQPTPVVLPIDGEEAVLSVKENLK